MIKEHDLTGIASRVPLDSDCTGSVAIPCKKITEKRILFFHYYSLIIRIYNNNGLNTSNNKFPVTSLGLIQLHKDFG